MLEAGVSVFLAEVNSEWLLGVVPGIASVNANAAGASHRITRICRIEVFKIDVPLAFPSPKLRTPVDSTKAEQIVVPERKKRPVGL